MKKIKIGVGIITLSLASLSYAVAPGVYLGTDLGVTNIHQQTRLVEVGSAALGTGPQLISVSPSNSQGFGGRLFLGANFNKYSGMELGYTYYGTAKYSVPTPPAPPPCNTPTVKVQAVDLVGKAILPLMPCTNTGLDFFVKGGVTFVNQTISGSLATSCAGGICPNNQTTNGVRPIVGVGAEYDINQNVVAGVTASRIISGGGSIQPADFIALSLSYHFVDKYCGQFLC